MAAERKSGPKPKKSGDKGDEKAAAPQVCHDIIVIGASAGGVEALRELVSRLPADLPAALFMVVHLAASPPSILPEILSRQGPLPVVHPIHGAAIERGKIYVAPPDSHLMLQEGYVRVVRGPKENGHRPAIDPLFRTAARAYGPRVVGVILTGTLDCGTAGLLSIKSLGGLAVVQDPKEAPYPDMPLSAITHVKVDYILPLHKIPPLLIGLAREPVKVKEADKISTEERTMSGKSRQEQRENGKRSELTCPECNGSLTEFDEGGLLRFRCHVGHAYSEESMLVEQSAALESALWSAVRALEESEMLARRMATRSDKTLAARFLEKADGMKQHTEVIRRMLLSGDKIQKTDAISAKSRRKNPL